jgi:starch synthase
MDDLAGKAVNKAELQSTFRVDVRPEVPVVGLVSRLVYQKGVDVLAEAIDRIMTMDVQVIILGTGEVWSHFFFGDLPNRFPGRVGAHIGYDPRLAHLVMGGSDFLLVPSRYEPCGLTQMQAMRYATVPIVRNTGGLADTVEQYVESTGAGDGFKFQDLSAGAIADTVGWAVSTYFDRPDHLAAMRQRGMRKRFEWSSAAEQYERLFEWACQRRRAG